MTREEHIVWCQRRAKGVLAKGNLQDGLQGFIFDMNKHPQTQINSALTMQALFLVEKDDAEGAKAFIERFS